MARLTPEIFFAEQAALPFQWGKTDCVSTQESWVRRVTGRGFVAESGQSYSSELEAEALLAARPLPIRLARALRLAGLARTSSPQAEDIAVIVTGTDMVAAVRGAAHWLFRNEAGINAAPLGVRVLGAWRIR